MRQIAERHTLSVILEKAGRRETLARNEIEFILGLRHPNDINTLFKSARDLRCRYFGDKIFLYGFVYVSTHCRNNCNFCYYRKSNTMHGRYRRQLSEIIEATRRLSDSGVHLIDLTLGEDPKIFDDQKRGVDGLIRLVKAVKEATGLRIMVSPGVVPDDVLAKLAAAEADWFACYQETHNPLVFSRLRPGQDYAARLKIKQKAHRMGMLIEEGILCGVGESDEDIAESIEIMSRLEASQLRVMSFVPQKGTPMQNLKAPNSLRERLIIAVLRLVFPDRLIPASLDVAGLAGLQSRLEAGANVVTSMVPPGFGLAGVAQSSLDIADARRTATSIVLELEKFGLQAASSSDYLAWTENRRSGIFRDISMEKIAC